MDKLIKQLQRDFKKNPKKVVLLGVLAVVCLWVMVPLFLPAEKKKPVNRPAVAAATTTEAAATPTAVAPAWRWQDIDRALGEDPRMRSFGDDDAQVAGVPPQRNPFETPFDVDAAMDELLAEVGTEIETEQTAAASMTAPGRATFESLPLQLSSTIIGGGESVAIINGRPFRAGAKIGTAYGQELTLKSVEARSAVVQWNGLTRTLRILSPQDVSSQSSLAGTKTAR